MHVMMSRLREIGLVLDDDVVGDGACLFRSISRVEYGDEGRFPELKTRLFNFMMDNRDEIGGFLGNGEEAYGVKFPTNLTSDKRVMHYARYMVTRKSFYGGEIELFAAHRCLGRNFIVFSAESGILTSFHCFRVYHSEFYDIKYDLFTFFSPAGIRPMPEIQENYANACTLHHARGHYSVLIRDNAFESTRPFPSTIRDFRDLQSWWIP
jgi:hypothetical protein